MYWSAVWERRKTATNVGAFFLTDFFQKNSDSFVVLQLSKHLRKDQCDCVEPSNERTLVPPNFYQFLCQNVELQDKALIKSTEAII